MTIKPSLVYDTAIVIEDIAERDKGFNQSKSIPRKIVKDSDIDNRCESNTRDMNYDISDFKIKKTDKSERRPRAGGINFLLALIYEMRIQDFGPSSYDLRKKHNVSAGTIILWYEKLLKLKLLDIKETGKRNKILFKLNARGVEYAEKIIDDFRVEQVVKDTEVILMNNSPNWEVNSDFESGQAANGKQVVFTDNSPNLIREKDRYD